MTNNFTQPCGNEHVIKLWVDECTGKFIDPITVTDAVITKHGKTLTEVLDLIFGNLKQNKDLLNGLKVRIEDLEEYKAEFDRLKILFDFIKDNYASKTDISCIEAELLAISSQLLNNQSLFLLVLQYLTTGSQGNPIDVDFSDLSGYLKTVDLLEEIEALDKFAKKVSSLLTGVTYPSSGGIVVLPSTMTGALYVADNSEAGHRFYFSFNGDVNGDGFTTVQDITALYSWLLDNDSSELVNPDLNGDGSITASDVAAVYDVLLNGYKPTQVCDKLNPGNIFELPEGTVFINGNNMYNVRNGDAELIGIIPDINGNINIQYSLPASPSLGAPAIGPMDPQVPEEVANMIEQAEIGELRSELMYEKDDAVINTYIVALRDKTAGKTLAQKVEDIEESIEEGTFDHSVINDDNIVIESKWKGLPQDHAQCLAYMKDVWDDSGTDRDIQYLQPLGSFKDFKRFFATNNTIEVHMFDELGLYKTSVSTFDVVDLTLTTNQFTGVEDTVIVANYTDQDSISYTLFWDGLKDEQPVIIQSDYFDGYLRAINYVNPEEPLEEEH